MASFFSPFSSQYQDTTDKLDNLKNINAYYIQKSFQNNQLKRTSTRWGNEKQITGIQ